MNARMMFAAWAAVGVLFMAGCIAPAGFLIWFPAVLLAAGLIRKRVRSPRFFFAFTAGIGATLIGLALINSTYVIFLLYGAVVVTGGVVMFAAFGPRTSHAEGPEKFPDPDR